MSWREGTGARKAGLRFSLTRPAHIDSTLAVSLMDIFKRKGSCRVDHPKKHPPIADRVNAVNRLLLTASGDVRLYIDPKCKHLIESLEKVIYKRRPRH